MKIIQNKSINLDLSNKCSLKCPACQRQLHYDGKNIPGNEMSLDDWDKLTDYFNNISLCGQVSDPTHHSDLYSLVKIALNKDVRLSISVAASFRSPAYFNRLFLLTQGRKVEWIFGIDGLPKDSCKYRINQDGEKLYKIMKMCSSLGNKTIWQHIVFNYNENTIEECKKLASDIGVTFRLMFSPRWEGENIKYKPTNEKYFLTRDLRY